MKHAICSLLLFAVSVSAEEIYHHDVVRSKLYYAHDGYDNKAGCVSYCDMIGGALAHDFDYDDVVHRAALHLFKHNPTRYFWLDTEEVDGQVLWSNTSNVVNASLWYEPDQPVPGLGNSVIMTNVDRNGKLMCVEDELQSFYPFCEIDLTNDLATETLAANIHSLRCQDRIPILELLGKIKHYSTPAPAASALSQLDEMQADMKAMKALLEKVAAKIHL